MVLHVMVNGHGCACCCFKLILLVLLMRSTKKLPSDDESTNTALPESEITSYRHFREAVQTRVPIEFIGYGDYGLRTTAGRALSFVCSTGLSRANIER